MYVFPASFPARAPIVLTYFTRVHHAANQMGVESKFEFLSRAQRAIQFMIAHIVSYLTHFVSRNAIPEIRVLCVSHGTRFSPRSLFVFLSMRLSVSAACVGLRDGASPGLVAGGHESFRRAGREVVHAWDGGRGGSGHSRHLSILSLRCALLSSLLTS